MYGNISEEEFLVMGMKDLCFNSFNKISNNYSTSFPVKPIGGLWASKYTPNKEYSSPWVEWCSYEMPEWLDKNCLVFGLKKESKILVIDSYRDLDDCIRYSPLKSEMAVTDSRITKSFIDFELLCKDFDGIYLTDNGFYECCDVINRLGENSLYGWDVPSLLLFNIECIDYYRPITLDLNKLVESDSFSY